MQLVDCGTSAERLTSRMRILVEPLRNCPKIRACPTTQSSYNAPFANAFMKPRAESHDNLIAENRRARFEYFIEEHYEAGLALQGWEVKSLRAGRAQITEAYVYVRGG